MDVLILLLFVSLMLVTLAVLLYLWSIKQRTHEHSDRLALLPLDEDDPARVPER